MSYPLDAYRRNVPGISHELEWLLTGPVRKAAIDFLKKKGEASLFKMTSAEQDEALKFLKKTQLQREKAISKLAPLPAALLVARARFLGLMGTKALEFAEDFQYLPGKGYRDAADYCSRAALRANFVPTASEVIPGWDPEDAEDYGFDDYQAY
ncbi:hypothetical protein [Rhizobium sp. BK176]|uniref:hypothetical protein n=1 Tax=Rhizobium sp. BK176 TaxID=2587071 RepID=UPI00216A39EA|nr:hypothetical protein [Rhizobium sp. BK176]MCS4089305.1 hypothetical protein [Rhizobium sp. BK176]